MSRSYKKNGILKYGTNVTKAKANRKFRHRNRQRLLEGRDLIQMYELTNPWEVNDVWSIYNEESKWIKRNPEFWSEERLQKLKRQYFNK